MKKGILCFFISSVLLCPYPELSAQGFFKKIAKGVENASKELEKATDKLSGAKQVTINNTSVTYSSPSSILKIDVDKVEMQGDKLILEFMLTNISDIDIRSYRIGCDFTKDNAKTYAIDNLGGRATVVVYLADKEPNRGGGYLGTNIPAGIPLRAIVRIGEINPKATSITQLRIDGHDWSNGNARKELNGGFIFKNIPIDRREENIETVSVTSSLNEKTVLKIPKTRGVMSLDDSYDKYETKKRMTTVEQTSLKAKIKKLPSSAVFEDEGQLVKGASIYNGPFGRLETILSVIEDYGTAEYLLSYDTYGKLIDCIRIALITTYGGDRGEGFVEGDIVTLYSSAEGSSFSAKYKIEPTLKFTQLQDWQEIDQ